MLQKNKLLVEVRDALNIEEAAVSIYLNHVKQCLPWFGLSEKDEAEVQDLLEKTVRDTEEHARILEKTFYEIEKADKNVF